MWFSVISVVCVYEESCIMFGFNIDLIHVTLRSAILYM